MTLKISYEILDGNLGDIGSDRAAVETYRDELEDAFQKAYPDAELDITIRWNSSGIGAGIKVESDEDADTVAIEMHLSHIGEKVFEVTGA